MVKAFAISALMNKPKPQKRWLPRLVREGTAVEFYQENESEDEAYVYWDAESQTTRAVWVKRSEELEKAELSEEAEKEEAEKEKAVEVDSEEAEKEAEKAELSEEAADGTWMDPAIQQLAEKVAKDVEDAMDVEDAKDVEDVNEELPDVEECE